jgi:tetratricopeptide (TPR) repeat protein
MLGRRTAWVLVGLAILGATLVLFSRLQHPSQPSRTAGIDGAAAPTVEVAGCDAVLRGPVCEVAAGTELTLWIPGAGPGSTVSVTADGGELASHAKPWPDGQSVTIKVPPGARLLEARVTRAGSVGSWKMSLAAPRAPVAAVVEARRLRAAGHLDEAAALLADGAPDENDRDVRLALRARIDYQRGHIDDAVAGYREVIALREARGRWSEAASDCSALLFLLLERNRIGEARPLVDKGAALSADYAVGRAEATFDEGRIAQWTGDLRRALRLTREAEQHFDRLGAARRVLFARQALATQLVELGRFRESIAVYQGLLAGPEGSVSECDRAITLADLGWAGLRLVEAEAGANPGFDVLEPLKAAVALRRSKCPDPNSLANVLSDVAQAELARGRPAAARDALEEAKRAERSPELEGALQRLHLDGKIALSQGSPAAALATFQRETDLAAALGAREEREIAAEDRAEAQLALGHEREALAALQEADAQVEVRAESVPLGEGRGSYLGARERVAQMEVELLAQLGRPDDAVAVVRATGARPLVGLRVTAAVQSLSPETAARWAEAIGRYRNEREAMETLAAHDWELSADRLAAAAAARKDADTHARATLDEALALLAVPREEPLPSNPVLPPGTIELFYFPTPSGWLAFAREGASPFHAQKLGPVDPRAAAEDVARRILVPFDDALGRAERVRLHVHGDLRRVDIHALPWRGAPLLEHASVEYALELDRTVASPASDPRRALVVADPTGDLPAARTEADAVLGALTAGGWRVDQLRGGAASGDAVRAAIGQVSLLHYAGHASFGGVDGVESSLRLAGGAELTPPDILALPHVPSVVALFGCDTGRESTTGILDTLGLANAFLAAGADGVVATSRVVDDALAKDVAAAFHAARVGRPGVDLAAALRTALVAARARNADSDWSAFRALVR